MPAHTLANMVSAAAARLAADGDLYRNTLRTFETGVALRGRWDRMLAGLWHAVALPSRSDLRALIRANRALQVQLTALEDQIARYERGKPR